MYDMLKPEMFDSDANEWIVSKTLSHFDSFQQLPALDVFKNEVDKVERDVLKQSIIDNLKQVWNGLESDDLDYVKEQSLEFCKNQTFKNAILESVDLLSEGGDSKFDVIKSKIDNAMKAGQDTDIGHEYKEDIVARYESTVRNVIPCGWPVIDELVDGGFGKGELIIFAAPPGIGKSWALVNVGMAAAKAGKNAAHYTLELNEGYVGQRYDSVLTGIPVPELKFEIDEVRRQVENIPGFVCGENKGELIIFASGENIKLIRSFCMLSVDFSELENFIGKDIGKSDWITIDQNRTQQFADATNDHQWIHLDAERAAKELPTKSTIAHGFLTLSLIVPLSSMVWTITGTKMTINYGLNKVRFINTANLPFTSSDNAFFYLLFIVARH
jgi:hypothetical protein